MPPGAPGEQPVEHLGHVAAHGLPHEQGRLHPFRIHNDAEPPDQIFQREVQRKRARRPMGRRVPHQAVCATLEIRDLRREQAPIRRESRQEHNPRPRGIRTLAHLVDDGSPPCIIALLDHAASSLRPCRPGHLACPCRSRPSCPTLPRPTAPVGVLPDLAAPDRSGRPSCPTLPRPRCLPRPSRLFDSRPFYRSGPPRPSLPMKSGRPEGRPLP